MWKLVEAGPLTKPKLEHEMDWPHSDVEERVEELSRLHYIFNCGTREKMKRKRGQKWLKVPSKPGLPAQLWDLSPAGVYALLVADNEARKKWQEIIYTYHSREIAEKTKVLEDSEKLLELRRRTEVLDEAEVDVSSSKYSYFELMLKLGALGDFGYKPNHGYPDESMVADALIFVQFDNKKIESIAEACSESMKFRIRAELRRERRRLQEFAERCKMLETKFKSEEKFNDALKKKQ